MFDRLTAAFRSARSAHSWAAIPAAARRLWLFNLAADTFGVRLHLNAKRIGKEGMTAAQLRKWYRQYGFSDTGSMEPSAEAAGIPVTRNRFTATGDGASRKQEKGNLLGTMTTTTTTKLISLVQKVTAIILAGLLAAPAFAQEVAPAPAPAAAPAASVLYEGTPIKLRLNDSLSSATAMTGQEILFDVTEDVEVNGVVVIPQGARALGEVTEAEHKKWAGRAGKLMINLSSVRLADGEKVSIRAQAGGNGKGHTGAMIGAMAATAIFTLGGSALFLLMHGKDIVIPPNTPVTAFVCDDKKLDLSKFTAPVVN